MAKRRSSMDRREIFIEKLIVEIVATLSCTFPLIFWILPVIVVFIVNDMLQCLMDTF